MKKYKDEIILIAVWVICGTLGLLMWYGIYKLIKLFL